MSEIDYVVKMADGSEIVIEGIERPLIHMDELSGQDLEKACMILFSNLGWSVKTQQRLAYESETFCPDLVLSDGNKDYGFVEIVTSMDNNTLIKKKKIIQLIIEKYKPELFILTNGIIFDVFYDGKYKGSQTTPPSLETVKRNERIRAYCEALMKREKEECDGK